MHSKWIGPFEFFRHRLSPGYTVRYHGTRRARHLTIKWGSYLNRNV